MMRSLICTFEPAAPADGLGSGTVSSDGTRAGGVDTDRIIAATVAAK